jgi:acetyl esterase/lipase
MIEQGSGNKGGHLNTSSTIGDVLSHPAFAGFGSLILPWDNRSYNESMPLSDIGLLLPYHSHVEPGAVVSALNRMIDDVNSGKVVFYDLYTEEQKRRDPTLKNTALFFFRGKPGAPFAIIAPGGGFSYVGSVHEGFPYAQKISNAGYNAFVLKYRVGHGATVPTQDMAAAISYIFRNAETLGVSPQNYSLWGSSAGARLAAAIGSQGAASFGGADLPKPSTVVMAYTGFSESSLDAPPTFVVVGEHDHIAPPSVMERRVTMLRDAGVNVEYHRYKNVGHGFGLGIGTSAEGWVAEAIRFWESAVRRKD